MTRAAVMTHNARQQLGDAQLAELCCAGDGGAFAILAERYRPALCRFLAQRLPETIDPEDLAQDTLARAYEQIHRYDDRWRFSTWLFTIGRRLAIDQMRRGRLERSAPPADEAAGAGPTPLRVVADREQRANLWQAARDLLTDDQHEALWLRYGQSMPVDAIARAMGRNAVSVRVLLYRARRKLAAAPPFLDALDQPGDT